MKHALWILCLLTILPEPALAETPQEKGLAIAVEADRRDTGFGDSKAEMKMILRNRHGEESVRDMRVKVLEVKDDGDKSIFVFDRPRDVKGTGLLSYSHKVGNDDQWLYLPALKRVKRISSANKSGSFMGSEFAYEDFASQEVEKYTYKYLRDEPCPGNDKGLECFVIERFPVDENSGYTRQIAWMDKQEYRPQKIAFYDRKNALLKTLVFRGYRQYLDRYWRADELFMENHQTGKSTVLQWSDYRFRNGFDDNDFTRASLKRVR
jgi:outer membrane lipoprotein-sorting protein